MSLKALRWWRNTGGWMVFWGILFYFFWTGHDSFELFYAGFGAVLFLIMNEIIALKKEKMHE